VNVRAFPQNFSPVTEKLIGNVPKTSSTESNEIKKLHHITSIVITSDDDVVTTIKSDMDTMATQEEDNEGLLSFKRALFPGNFKKNLQHRYFSSQKRSGSSSSTDTSSFDKAESARSLDVTLSSLRGKRAALNASLPKLLGDTDR
jgi:hypothetical protein